MLLCARKNTIERETWASREMKRALDERFGVYVNRLSQNGQNLEGKDGGWRARPPAREEPKERQPCRESEPDDPDDPGAPELARHGTLGINPAKRYRDTLLFLGVVVPIAT